MHPTSREAEESRPLGVAPARCHPLPLMPGSPFDHHDSTPLIANQPPSCKETNPTCNIHLCHSPTPTNRARHASASEHQPSKPPRSERLPTCAAASPSKSQSGPQGIASTPTPPKFPEYRHRGFPRRFSGQRRAAPLAHVARVPRLGGGGGGGAPAPAHPDVDAGHATAVI
jgi:hypothetical protein